MGVSAEVVHSLRVLGLPPSATASEVRSAFRRLARTYHPDVAGRQYARKFEQIAKAYALLKDLPQEELPRGERASYGMRSAKNAREAPRDGPKNDGGRRISFGEILGKPFAWYRKRLSRLETEKERLRRSAEDAQKKVKLEREARINTILSRGERLIENLLSGKEREMQSIGTRGLVSRLMSDISPVRHLALSHLGESANGPEVFEALSSSLQKWDIDEKTTRLVSALPLKPENHRKLAHRLAAKAATMPDAMLSHLLRLYNVKAADRELLETYLNHAGASGIVLILRRWPQGAFISEATLCRLMSREDESVLLTLLNAMKQRSIPCPKSCLEGLNAHLSHPNTAVRVWAKTLLSVAKN